MTTFTTEDRVRAQECGCGRSPTGHCIGWHDLDEDEYRQRLAEYEAEQNRLAHEQQSRTQGLA
jgi:hypothetical protein